MFKFYRSAIVATIVAAGLAACTPDITNQNSTTVIVHGDTTIVTDSTSGKVDTIIKIDSTGTKKIEPDSIWMNLPRTGNFFMAANHLDSAIVIVYPVASFVGRENCLSDNAGVITATKSKDIAGRDICIYKAIGVSQYDSLAKSYKATRIGATTVDTHTFPDCTSDRLYWWSSAVVTPTGHLLEGERVALLPMKLCA